MADSDQAIRDIVAQLQGTPTDAQAAAVPQSAPASWAGPEVTPTMLAPAAGPGAPLSLAPPLPAAKAAPDDWTAPVPTMAPPVFSVAPMGAMVAAPRRAPTMATILAPASR